MPSILIYAELLLNIQHVTVFLVLPSDPGPDTAASLSLDRRSIVITHQRNEQSLNLPCQVAAIASSDFPFTTSRELSFRLEVAANLDLTQTRRRCSEGKDAPWMASSMTPESLIACRSCKSTLLKETIQLWKDLPSENWAEMMDFWHCHKPSTEDAHSELAHDVTKGYAASNQIAPSHGVGLADISHLLLAENDCTGLQTSENDQFNLKCSTCSKTVGFQARSGSVQLFKWSISVKSARNAPWESYPVQKFICAQLQTMIQSQATRKFLAYSGDVTDSKEALLLWVFNPDLIYSTTSLLQQQEEQKGPKHAMKVFYQTVPEPSILLERQFVIMDELRLPDAVLRSLHVSLKESGNLMPITARKFKEWDIGLLEY